MGIRLGNRTAVGAGNMKVLVSTAGLAGLAGDVNRIVEV